MIVSNNANTDRPLPGKYALHLNRTFESRELTLGMLTLLGCDQEADQVRTLELPHRGNHRGVSRIPSGDYAIKRKTNGRYFNAYRNRWGHEYSIEIADVSNRSAILIHSGNYAHHTRGCILVGQGFGTNCVVRSRPAYERIYAHLDKVFKEGYTPFIRIRDLEVQDDE